MKKILLIMWMLCIGNIPFSLGLSYLELERMVKEGMTKDLLQAQIERENAFYKFDEIIYLKERKLPADLVDFLMRYYLSNLPHIDVDFLIYMKSLKLGDELINFLVDRSGFEGFPLSPDNIIALKKAKVDDKLIERLIRTTE